MKVTVHIMRHSEIAHHESNVSLTEHGRVLAWAAGKSLGAEVTDRETIFVQYAPAARTEETATLVHAGLLAALKENMLAGQVGLRAPSPEAGLYNVRFFMNHGEEPQEPARAFSRTNSPRYLDDLPPARAAFFRGFWKSEDRLGYWLTHGSAGGAETPEMVYERLRAWLRSIFFNIAGGANFGRSTEAVTRFIGVTHSGTIRAFLCKDLGMDPGEPDYCEQIRIEAADHDDQPALTFRGRRTLLAWLENV
jgi:broad specificity phosphatase PhoE